jgi:RNA polymerase-binding transcription factor DksA
VRDARVLESLGEADLREVGAINAALRRLDDDNYGFCETCGREIPDARLAVLPEASKCTSCATAAEKAAR